MRAEAAVLYSDDGLWHIGRQVGDADIIAVKRAALGKHRSICREDHDSGLAGRDLEQTLLIEAQPQIAETRRTGKDAPEYEGQEKSYEAEAGSPAVSGRTARREAVSAAFATAKKRRFPALLLAAALPLTPAGKSHRRSLP